MIVAVSIIVIAPERKFIYFVHASFLRNVDDVHRIDFVSRNCSVSVFRKFSLIFDGVCDMLLVSGFVNPDRPNWEWLVIILSLICFVYGRVENAIKQIAVSGIVHYIPSPLRPLVVQHLGSFLLSESLINSTKSRLFILTSTCRSIIIFVTQCTNSFRI